MAKNKGGRPTIITEQVLQKLEQAFSLGCTDKEACVYADISPATLYNYQKENPKFLERKELLKEKPILRARTTIIQNLDSIGNAQWFLNKKKKDEFGDNYDITSGGKEVKGINVTIVDGRKDLIEDDKKDDKKSNINIDIKENGTECKGDNSIKEE